MKEVTKEIRESEEALAAMLPNSEAKVWQVVGLDAHGTQRELRYVQSELSFFEKQDFTTLIGGYFDRFAEGEFGLTIKDVWDTDLRNQISIPTEVSADDAEKMVADNSGLIKAIIKVFNELPDLQMKVILIALGVPPNERKFVEEVLRGPVWKGGLTDEQGFEILKTFIDQNAEAIRDFFLKRARDLLEHAQDVLLPAQEEETTQNGDTHGGTPSSITPPPVASIPSPSETGPPPVSS